MGQEKGRANGRLYVRLDFLYLAGLVAGLDH